MEQHLLSTERKPCQPSILSPAKMSFKRKVKIKTFRHAKAEIVYQHQTCTTGHDEQSPSKQKETTK